MTAGKATDSAKKNVCVCVCVHMWNEEVSRAVHVSSKGSLFKYRNPLPTGKRSHRSCVVDPSTPNFCSCSSWVLPPGLENAL